jgi:hypothetical protein
MEIIKNMTNPKWNGPIRYWFSKPLGHYLNFTCNNYYGNNKFAGELLSMLPIYFLHSGTSSVKNNTTTHLDIISSLGEFGYGIRNKMVFIPNEMSGLTLAHELAHMIEIKRERVILDDFGLKTKNNNVNEEDLPICGIARENRVRTIQGIINNPEVRNKTLCESNKNWKAAAEYNVKNNINFKFSNMNQVYEWERSIIDSTKNKYTKDYIYEQFKIRADYIRECIESN